MKELNFFLKTLSNKVIWTFVIIVSICLTYAQEESTNEEVDISLDFFRNCNGILSIQFKYGIEQEKIVIIILGDTSSINKISKEPREIEIGSLHTKGNPPECTANVGYIIRLLHASNETKNTFLKCYAEGIEKGEFAAMLLSKPIPFGEKTSTSGAVPLDREALLKILE